MQKVLCLALLTTFLLFSCGKDQDDFFPHEEPIAERVVASVLGIVTDETGQPVAGATVLLENQVILTNDLGLFIFDDIDISSDAYVRVEKPGFFNGSRRFYPKAGNTANVRIQLIKAQSIGQFQSGAGATLTVDGGTSMTFPADAISYPNGTPYSGMVRVAAAPLYTDDPSLFEKMPGDLVGRSVENRLRALGSFGMIAVELHDDAGDLLQVAEGKQVTIEYAIANDQLSTAPSSIPLWYFDETTGYWKEEGEAQRQGNHYTMNVSHFSFWNCDAPFELITLTGSVVYDNGEPAAGVWVWIDVPGLNTQSGGLTDDQGVFTGKVPANEEMTLTVSDYQFCEVFEYPQSIGPFADDATLPPITIEFSQTPLTTLTGALVDCDGNPVQNGVVEVRAGDFNGYMYIDDESEFTWSFYNCDGLDVTVVGYDYVNLKESLPVTLPNAETIEFGTISVCENLTEWLIIHVDGDDIAFINPYLVNELADQSSMGAWGSQGGGSFDSLFIFLNIPGDEIGTFQIGNPNGAEAHFDLGFGFGRIESGTCTFTYYGDTGDFVQGTLEGVYVETNWQTQETMSYNFTGEFNVRRE